MTDWDERVAYMRESFVDSLVSRGFTIAASGGTGLLGAVLVGQEVEITLGAGFPFSPPRVRTLIPTVQSWHLDNSGFLCLYTSEGTENLPWLNADALLNRIRDWFKWNDEGWPEDAPVLDLEAYLNLTKNSNIIGYSRLDAFDGDYVVVDGRNERFLRVTGAGKAPKKQKRMTHYTGFVTNIGQVDIPPRSWEELLDRCPSDEKDKILSAIRTGRLQFILARYRRGKQSGCLALWFATPESEPAVFRTVSTDHTALRLRGGDDAEILASKHVYLIGAGALGSYIGDLLNRAGIGTLTIRDHDTILPGNLIRHAIGFREAHGLSKAGALSQWLGGADYSVTKLDPIRDALTDPADALDIFDSCDLVIDATADGSVTRMLTDAAVTMGHTFITACTKGGGHVLRVDIVPPLNGSAPLPDNAPDVAPDVADAVFEDGCSDPVSRTPPHTIVEAAGMVVRHAIALLKHAPLTDAGELREW